MVVTQMMDSPEAAKLFPKDAISRAREYLDAIGSTGAYTESQGAAIFREQIAKVSANSLQSCSTSRLNLPR